MRLLVGVALVASLATACSDDEYDPDIDPHDFVDRGRSVYFPLLPGTLYQYSVAEIDQQSSVTITGDTKEILGVTCFVVHHETRAGGVLVEDTYDYYGQQRDGTVWHFGREGSWTAGVEGAKPGIVVPGKPTVGQKYRHEYVEGEVEGQAEVLATDAVITVPYAFFIGCLQTREYSQLEPHVEENHYYCPSIGLTRSVATKGDPQTEDLVMLTWP